MRVVILRDYAQKNFPSTPLLDYASEVEKITTSKVKVLILSLGVGKFFIFITKFFLQMKCTAKHSFRVCHLNLYCFRGRFLFMVIVLSSWGNCIELKAF
jgi:hypothetical protein